MTKDRMPNWESHVYRFAKSAHKLQLDDGQNSYFEAHILHVVSIAKAMCSAIKDEKTKRNIIRAAYLHDTIEDTDTGTGELVKEFGKEVASLVLELTHDGKKDQHGYYFPRLQSENAILVKFADRLSNLSRMDPWDVARRAQYLRKSKFWRAFPGDDWKERAALVRKDHQAEQGGTK